MHLFSFSPRTVFLQMCCPRYSNFAQHDIPKICMKQFIFDLICFFKCVARDIQYFNIGLFGQSESRPSLDFLHTELRNVKFFTQTKIWVWNFTPKTRNSRLICFRDKTRKSCSIQVIVGLVYYVRCLFEYLHRIWVECKCAWVKITLLKYRI